MIIKIKSVIHKIRFSKFDYLNFRVPAFGVGDLCKKMHKKGILYHGLIICER